MNRITNTKTRNIFILVIRFFLVMVSFPYNFYKSYIPLFTDLFKGKVIATEPDRQGLVQYWYYHTYYKIFKKYGFFKARNCYMFFESFGEWNKENFYIDYVAYYFYGKFGIRGTVLFTNIVIFFSILWSGIVFTSLPLWIILIFSLIIIGSPYFTDIFVFIIKPEVLAWPFYLLAILSLLNEQYYFYLSWGILTILGNFTVSLLFVATITIYHLGKFEINYWYFGILLFYFFYNVWRLLPTLKTSIHGRINEHFNKEEIKNKLRFGFWQWVSLFTYFLPLITTLYPASQFHQVYLVIILGGITYFIFYKIIMFGDYHTIFRFLLLNNLILLSQFPQFSTFIALIIFIAINYLRIDPSLQYFCKGTKLVFDRPIMNKLKQFLALVKNDARVIIEKRKADRGVFFDEQISWHFLPALHHACIDNNLSIVPNILMYDVPLIEKFIRQKMGVINSSSNLKDLMDTIGANYILAYSQSLIQHLKQSGFKEVSFENDWASIFPGSEKIPSLHILESPWGIKTVKEGSQISLHYNKIQFLGKPGRYHIRYKWYPHLQFIENNTIQKIEKTDNEFDFFWVTKDSHNPAVISFGAYGCKNNS